MAQGSSETLPFHTKLPLEVHPNAVAYKGNFEEWFVSLQKITTLHHRLVRRGYGREGQSQPHFSCLGVVKVRPTCLKGRVTGLSCKRRPVADVPPGLVSSRTTPQGCLGLLIATTWENEPPLFKYQLQADREMVYKVYSRSEAIHQ